MTATKVWSDGAAIEIHAAPEHLWEMIADVTRMGEWSPVCRSCEWIDGAAQAEVGARFVGHNRQGPIRWSRQCEVTVSDPGRELSFRTLFKGQEATRWRYRLEPTPTGTGVVETYEVVSMPAWVQFLHRVPGVHTKARRDGVRNMTRTLRRLRAAAEEHCP